MPRAKSSKAKRPIKKAQCDLLAFQKDQRNFKDERVEFK